MIRAFKLEWLKLRNYKVFWILMGMYLLALIVITSFGVFFLEYLKSKGADFDGIDPTIVPIYDFPDIWQNTTYLASFLKVLLGFIVIISVNNDLSYLTLRQNVIDGISKKEFVLSKVSLILFLGLVSSLFLFLAGLVNGSIYSHVHGASVMFAELEFIAAYFFDTIVFCSFAFLVSIIIKKSGFAIIAIFLYTMMFEPILTAIFQYNPKLQGTIWESIAPYFPVQAMNNLIPVPYPKYIFQEIVDDVSLQSVLICAVWLAIFLATVYLRLTKKDLK